MGFAMQGEYKKFDKKLFEKFDNSARERTKQFLRSQGCEVVDNPNQYGVDLIAEKNGKKYFVECEVKNVWSGKKFPPYFKDVQLPARKEKFFGNQTAFFIWNKELDNAVYFWSSEIKHLKPQVVGNKYMKKGEKFFKIPLDLVNMVDKEI